MTSYAENKLRDLSQKLLDASEQLPPEIAEEMAALRQTLLKFSDSWSQSQSGYHVNVYYRDFHRPPAGAMFHTGYGLQPGRSGNCSIGDWVEYTPKEVNSRILAESRAPNLGEIKRLATAALYIYRKSKSELDSITAQIIKMPSDEFVTDTRDRLNSETFHEPDYQSSLKRQFRASTTILFDTRAAHGPKGYAQHQIINAKLMVAYNSFAKCKALSELCLNLADHLRTVEVMAIPVSTRPRGTKIFIGHGHSEEWLRLKEFLTERLGLQCDEFSRVPNAGGTNIERLSSMLDDAQFAFIVMTAEDEVGDGETRARENVVHEAGLFHGRLGFKKAILVADRSCHIFSNIDGLERIDFSVGNIKESFSEVHAVLVREGVVSKP